MRTRPQNALRRADSVVDCWALHSSVQDVRRTRAAHPPNGPVWGLRTGCRFPKRDRRHAPVSARCLERLCVCTPLVAQEVSHEMRRRLRRRRLLSSAPVSDARGSPPRRTSKRGDPCRAGEQGAARAARQQRPVPVRLRTTLSSDAAVTRAALDGSRRAEYLGIDCRAMACRLAFRPASHQTTAHAIHTRGGESGPIRSRYEST